METAEAPHVTVLRAMIREARAKGLWIFSGYQAIWWSPNQFETVINNGHFRWSPENFRLRDPRERVKQLEESVVSANKELDALLKQIIEG